MNTEHNANRKIIRTNILPIILEEEEEENDFEFEFDFEFDFEMCHGPYCCC
jgi:hypothetical protein